MKQPRRLWIQATAPLLAEVIEIHQRVHTVFGRQLAQTQAFPLFQGKRRNRTVVYNATYDEAARLERGVFFITTGSIAQPLSSEQWPIRRRSFWISRARRLRRIAGSIYDAVADEWNSDLAPLKMPVKLFDWINDLAMEFAQRTHLDPNHPQFARSLNRVFAPSHSAAGPAYELPHEGLGGLLAAYLLAVSRQRINQKWAEVFAMTDGPAYPWTKAPELWINLTPGSTEGAALGFPRPPRHSGDSPGGIELARYPRSGPASSADKALHAVTHLFSAGLCEIVASQPEPKSAHDLSAWEETLHALVREGPTGAKIWNLAKPHVLEAARQSIKNWDKSFARWADRTD